MLGHKQRPFGLIKAEVTKTELFTTEESGSFDPHRSRSPGSAVTPGPCRSCFSPGTARQSPSDRPACRDALLLGVTQHQALLCQPADPDPRHHSQRDSEMDKDLFFGAGAELEKGSALLAPPPASINITQLLAGRKRLGLQQLHQCPELQAVSRITATAPPRFPKCHLSTLLSRVPAAHPG